MSRLIRHVVIRGRVQGVGYRDWTRRAAVRRGIEGWVRNRRDGSVEALFWGEPQDIADMIAACRKGPPSASVESIAEEEGTDTDLQLRGEARFAVLPTI